MNGYVALLRGVNVGGKNCLPMKELSQMFSRFGCGDVRTYIQSGNVVFTAPSKVAAGLPGLMAAEIETKFDIRTPVVLRTAAQMKDVLRFNPYLKPEIPEASLHVYFLADVPRESDVGSLDPLRSAPDVFAVRGREIYLQLPNGMGRTKLTNNYFDSRLKTVSTARNWRTVTTLCEMLAG
jgi:uncharacterized protein (DUF1697 family)